MTIEHNPNYIHHQDKGTQGVIRELVFGMEDGMVSTLGAITGIAAATGSVFTTLLSGFVIVSVESISMGVGTYLSSKSEKDIDKRKLMEETEELQKYPQEEEEELRDMYVEDGWPAPLAAKMAKEASKNHDLFLQEMAYRELDIISTTIESPLKNSIVMLFSYIVGGAIPLVAYLFLPIHIAIYTSIILTLIGLFVLGVFTTKFTKRSWWKAGLEMFGLASTAALVGYVVGQVVDTFFLIN